MLQCFLQECVFFPNSTKRGVVVVVIIIIDVVVVVVVVRSTVTLTPEHPWHHERIVLKLYRFAGWRSDAFLTYAVSRGVRIGGILNNNHFFERKYWIFKITGVHSFFFFRRILFHHLAEICWVIKYLLFIGKVLRVLSWILQHRFPPRDLRW